MNPDPPRHRSVDADRRTRIENPYSTRRFRDDQPAVDQLAVTGCDVAPPRCRITDRLLTSTTVAARGHRRRHGRSGHSEKGETSEITPLLIITKLEQYDYAGATAIAVVMLMFSFALLLAINLLQWWGRRRAGTP